MPQYSREVSPVDSLDDGCDGQGDGQPEQSGKIKVVDTSILSQLVSNSPLPVYKPAPTYMTTPNYSEQVKNDMDEYQFVNPDIDDDMNLSLTSQPTEFRLTDETPVPETPATFVRHRQEPTPATGAIYHDLNQRQAPAKPLQSHSPKQSALLRPTQSQAEAEKRTSSNSRFVPKLALTDSLICDDPDPDAARIVHDSLDSSMDEEDFERVQNLMNSKQPLPNPFNPHQPTPDTLNELSISLALVQSATPRPIYSQSDLQTSVMSSYADDDPTPRPQTYQIHQDGSYGNSQVLDANQDQYPNAEQQYHVPQLHQQSQQQMHVMHQQTISQQHPMPSGPQYGLAPQAAVQMQQQIYNPSHMAYSSHIQTPHQQNPQFYQHMPQQLPQQLHQQQPLHPHQQSMQYTQQNLHHHQPQPQSYRQNNYPEHLHTQQMQQPVNSQQHTYAQYHQQPNTQQQPSQQQQHPEPTYHQQHLQQVPRYPTQSQSYTQHQPSQSDVKYNKSSPIASPKTSPRHGYQTPKQNVVGTVAPKPVQPDRDFIERNKERARGVSSAKGGYASRMMQAKQKKEEIKNWAPGMVVQRKKAASADNALRTNKAQPLDSDRMATAGYQRSEDHVRGDEPPVRTVWEQRAAQLSQAKADKKKGITPGRDRSPEKTSMTGRSSITESRVKLDLNLDVPTGFAPTDPRMKLIGPIPQQQGVARNISPRGYAPPTMSGVPANDHHSGPIPRYHSPTGPVENHSQHHPHTQQLHSVNNRINITGPVHQQQHFASYNQQSIDDTQYHDQVEEANQSYNQYYQSSNHQGYPATGSRWNSHSHQKPPNFVPSQNDLTLDDIIALEQQKLASQPRKSTDLNPYQAVPPISHSMDDSEGEEGDETGLEGGGYSQIHKSQKEKDEKGANYKKYTLKDYKKLNLEVKLGGLGPSADPSVLKEKHEKRRKQLQLAKEARELDAKRAQNKPKTAETKKEPKPSQPSGRKLAQEYAKNIPKPKVVPKNPTPAPQVSLPSARSLSKLNDMTTDRQQLTYRAADNSPTRHNPHTGFYQQSAGIPHSYSTPSLTHPGLERAGVEELNDQFGYLETIEALHKRHLAEKQLISGVRQKI